MVLNREYWRLATTIFLHGGLIHLAMNMWGLFVVGPLVERLYGNLAFAIIYLASGVGGAIASLAASPFRVGVGASGAICGILGALVAFLIVHRRAIPKSILKSFRISLISVVILMAILGSVVPNIDHQAHLGGLATGFLSGLLLTRPWPIASSRWVVLRRAAATLLIVASLTAVAAFVTRRAFTTPDSRLLAVQVYLQPAIEEFRAIASDSPSTLVLRRDASDPQANLEHLKDVRALIQRAIANQNTARRLRVPDAPLQNTQTAFADARASQLGGLRAAERFLETGDTENLNGAGGVLESMTAIKSALRSFEEEQKKFQRANNSVRIGAGS